MFPGFHSGLKELFGNAGSVGIRVKNEARDMETARRGGVKLGEGPPFAGGVTVNFVCKML